MSGVLNVRMTGLPSPVQTLDNGLNRCVYPLE
jgi:hypothetical protein